MLRTQAWERLNDSAYSGSLSMDHFYNLLVTAGYHESSARKAASERGWERMKAGVKV